MWISATLILLILFVVIWISSGTDKNGPPGPKGVPIFGSIFHILRNPFKKLQEYADIYGPVYTLKVGPLQFLFLNDIATIQEAFSSNDFCDRPSIIAELTGIGRKGIILLPPGSYHHQQKKTAISLLREIGVGSPKFDDTIRPYLQNMMSLIESYPGVVNIQDVCSNVMSDVIGGITFGDYVYKDCSETSLQIRSMISENFTNNPALIMTGKFLPVAVKKMLDKFVDMENNISKLKKLLHVMIECHYSKTEKMGVDKNCFVAKYIEEYASSHNGETLYGNMEEEGQLVATLIDFFQAGCETTSTSLQWMFLFLAANPTVQKKVQQEIDDVFGTDLPSLREKSKLKFTVATMYEALRIRPTAPLGAPHCVTNNLKFHGYNIPANTPVFSNFLSAHYNPKDFPDPDQLKPERFLDENGNLNRLRYMLSFGTGSRSCVGEQFAKYIILSIIIHVLQKYDLRGKDKDGKVNLGYTAGINMVPNETKISFCLRQKSSVSV